MVGEEDALTGIARRPAAFESKVDRAMGTKSLEIRTEAGHDRDLAVVYGNLGIVYKNQGRFEQAIQAYEKSLGYSTKLGLERLTANQYSNLGVVYVLQGRYDSAIEMQRKCLEICQRLDLQKTAASAAETTAVQLPCLRP